MMNVVAADLEGTITAGVAWQALRDFLLAQGREADFVRYRRRQMAAYAWVKVGFGAEQAFKERWILGLLGLFAGFSEAQFAEVAEWVVERELWPKRRPAVVAELADHAANGRSVVIVSGMFQPILDVFAARMEVAALGTPLQVENGRLTGGVSIPFNVGERKVAALRARFGDGLLAAAYGDTLPDAPMLAISQEPVVVCPAPDLRKLAEANGWRVLEG